VKEVVQKTDGERALVLVKIYCTNEVCITKYAKRLEKLFEWRISVAKLERVAVAIHNAGDEKKQDLKTVIRLDVVDSISGEHMDRVLKVLKRVCGKLQLCKDFKINLLTETVVPNLSVWEENKIPILTASKLVEGAKGAP